MLDFAVKLFSRELNLMEYKLPSSILNFEEHNPIKVTKTTARAKKDLILKYLFFFLALQHIFLIPVQFDEFLLYIVFIYLLSKIKVGYVNIAATLHS